MKNTIKITATIDARNDETTEATIYADGQQICEVTLLNGAAWGDCPDCWCSDYDSLCEVAEQMGERAAALAVDAVHEALALQP